MLLRQTSKPSPLPTAEPYGLADLVEHIIISILAGQTADDLDAPSIPAVLKTASSTFPAVQKTAGTIFTYPAIGQGWGGDGSGCFCRSAGEVRVGKHQQSALPGQRR